MSRSSFSSMSINVDLLNAVYERKTSIENVVQAFQESLIQNKTILIYGNNEEISYYVKRGLSDEGNY